MARVEFAVGAGASDSSSDIVDALFFGGNFLFDRDRVGAEGTWDEKSDALNLGLIRYPGGTITERYFDITDPDRGLVDGAHGGDVLGVRIDPAGMPENGLWSLRGDGGIEYTSDEGFEGVERIAYRASDGMAESELAQALITVRP